MDFNKLHLRESLEVSNAASEKAAMSADKKKDPFNKQRQRDGMSQKQGLNQKSNVVFGTEEYFTKLNRQIELHKLQEKARHDWRTSIQEEKKPKEDPEGNHPYVAIMPSTSSKAKEVKKKYKENEKQDTSLTQNEQMEFEELLGNLIESEKPFDPDARRKQRGAMLKKQAQNAPKDTRTDAQKMTDATGPRKGSNFRGD